MNISDLNSDLQALYNRIPEHIKDAELVFEPRGGVWYFQVGGNASHVFAVGQKEDGSMWRGSCGEDGWDEELDEPICDGWKWKQIDSLRDLGYCGHY